MSAWHPFRPTIVPASDTLEEADAFHGNVVLLRRAIYERVGYIDGRFGHGLADYDYALRARAAGFRVLVAPGIVGMCRANATRGTWADASLPLRARWRHFLGPKGRAPRRVARYLRRHGGPVWPAFWVGTYLKFGAVSLIDAGRRVVARSTGRSCG